MLHQLHPGPPEYKSSRVGTTDKDVPRSTGLEKREHRAHCPQPASHSVRHKGSTVLTVPPSSSLGSTSSPHSCKAREADSLMRKLHLVLFKTRSCSSRTPCLEQAMEQQQLNPGENSKSCSATIYVSHSNSGRATTEHHVAKSIEQHPQCFLLQKAPTRLRRLRLLRMNGPFLWVDGFKASYTATAVQPHNSPVR